MQNRLVHYTPLRTKGKLKLPQKIQETAGLKLNETLTHAQGRLAHDGYWISHTDPGQCLTHRAKGKLKLQRFLDEQ